MVDFDLPFIVMNLAIGLFLYSFTHALIPSMLGTCTFSVYLPDLPREFSLNLCLEIAPKPCLWIQLSGYLVASFSYNVFLQFFRCTLVSQNVLSGYIIKDMKSTTFNGLAQFFTVVFICIVNLVGEGRALHWGVCVGTPCGQSMH